MAAGQRTTRTISETADRSPRSLAAISPRPGRPLNRSRRALLERIPGSPPAQSRKPPAAVGALNVGDFIAPAGGAGNVIFHQPHSPPLAQPLGEIPRHQGANVILQLLPQLPGLLIAGVAATRRQRELMPAATSYGQAGESGENHGERSGPGVTRGEADSRGSGVRPERRGFLPGHVGAINGELGAEPVQQFPAPAMQDAVASRIAYPAVGFWRGLRPRVSGRDRLPLTIMFILVHQATIGRRSQR